MSKMFYNYDTNIDKDLTCPLIPPPTPLTPMQSLPNISMLYNIKGEMYGVEVKHQMPFTLYLHLDEMHGWDISKLVAESIIEFKLHNSGNHKVALEKIFAGSAVFIPNSSDLVLSFIQEEIKDLKQESYEMSIVLRYPTGFYKLFSEHDGLLVVR